MATALAFGATFVAIRQQGRRAQLARLGDGLTQATKVIEERKWYAERTGRLNPVGSVPQQDVTQ